MERMWVGVLLVFIVLVTVGSVSFGEVSGSVSPPAIVIDVRTQVEWDSGHLEGATLIPYDRLEGEISQLVPNKKSKIALYCWNIACAGAAADTLKKLGYDDVSAYSTLRKAARSLEMKIVK